MWLRPADIARGTGIVMSRIEGGSGAPSLQLCVHGPLTPGGGCVAEGLAVRLLYVGCCLHDECQYVRGDCQVLVTDAS